MNQVHFHLLLNHLPVVGTVMGLAILLLGYTLRQEPVKRMALFIFIISALGALPVFLTGEGAEEAVENIPGITDSMVETHEDLASFYIWLMGGLGVLSLLVLGLDLTKRGKTNYLYISVLILSLITIGVSARVGTTGGEIRHTEIRKDAITQNGVNDRDRDEEEGE